MPLTCTVYAAGTTCLTRSQTCSQLATRASTVPAESILLTFRHMQQLEQPRSQQEGRGHGTLECALSCCPGPGLAQAGGSVHGPAADCAALSLGVHGPAADCGSVHGPAADCGSVHGPAADCAALSPGDISCKSVWAPHSPFQAISHECVSAGGTGASSEQGGDGSSEDGDRECSSGLGTGAMKHSSKKAQGCCQELPNTTAAESGTAGVGGSKLVQACASVPHGLFVQHGILAGSHPPGSCTMGGRQELVPATTVAAAATSVPPKSIGAIRQGPAWPARGQGSTTQAGQQQQQVPKLEQPQPATGMQETTLRQDHSFTSSCAPTTTRWQNTHRGQGTAPSCAPNASSPNSRRSSSTSVDHCGPSDTCRYPHIPPATFTIPRKCASLNPGRGGILSSAQGYYATRCTVCRYARCSSMS